MKLWEECKVTNKKFSSCRGFLNHLRTLNLSSKQYYDKFYKRKNEGICYCGKQTTYHSFHYKEYCSDVCSNKSEKHKQCVSTRFIRNPKALENFKSKRKNVNINLNKRRETIKKKCELMNITEFEYYSNHSKKGYQNISPEKRKEYIKKRMNTLNNSGIVCGRSSYKTYDFFDEKISLQGYEPVVLNYLIEDLKMKKEEIVVGKGNIPIIEYENRLYFPDFFIPKSNLLIEVKSKYTYEQNKETVHKKCLASIKHGYSILLLIVSRHEARNCKLDGSKKILDWAISSQAPNPKWYGEGSTTILNGVESSDSKNNSTNIFVG